MKIPLDMDKQKKNCARLQLSKNILVNERKKERSEKEFDEWQKVGALE